MPILLLIAAMILIPAAVAISIPFSIVLRIRASTVRRQARGWLAGFNALALSVSVCIFLVSATITSHWIPDALRYSVIGMLGGAALGIIGAGISRWEHYGRTLYYTPNRWLVLTVTLVVAARLLFGFWRAWHAWSIRGEDESWLAAAGIAGSMSVGALVLGYYFVFWISVWRKIKRHQTRYL